MCAGTSSDRSARRRIAPCRLLALLPESVLHLIISRLPGRDAARAMGACRAFAAAVRGLRETNLVLEMDATPPNKVPSGPAGAAKRRLQHAAAGVLGTHDAAITMTASCLWDRCTHAATAALNYAASQSMKQCPLHASLRSRCISTQRNVPLRPASMRDPTVACLRRRAAAWRGSGAGAEVLAPPRQPKSDVASPVRQRLLAPIGPAAAAAARAACRCEHSFRP